MVDEAVLVSSMVCGQPPVCVPTEDGNTALLKERPWSVLTSNSFCESELVGHMPSGSFVFPRPHERTSSKPSLEGGAVAKRKRPDCSKLYRWQWEVRVLATKGASQRIKETSLLAMGPSYLAMSTTSCLESARLPSFGEGGEGAQPR